LEAFLLLSCCKLTGGKINPLIGNAGVSAMPIAARVSQKVAQEYNPSNFVLMQAIGIFG
jgi:oxaloacetate decarboxylase beta subunit